MREIYEVWGGQNETWHLLDVTPNFERAKFIVSELKDAKIEIRRIPDKSSKWTHEMVAVVMLASLAAGYFIGWASWLP